MNPSDQEQALQDVADAYRQVAKAASKMGELYLALARTHRDLATEYTKLVRIQRERDLAARRG